MDRRSFFAALAAAVVVPAVPRRVYSFLWDGPLVTVPDVATITAGGDGIGTFTGARWSKTFGGALGGPELYSDHEIGKILRALHRGLEARLGMPAGSVFA
jgi:hypothetical protein